MMCMMTEIIMKTIQLHIQPHFEHF